MKKLSVLLVVTTMVQPVCLRGMNYIKKFLAGKKTPQVVVVKKKANDDSSLKYESEELGTFALLDHPNTPISLQDLLFIVEEKSKKKRRLLETVYENAEKDGEKKRKKRKRKQSFQICGLQFPGTKNLDDFEKIYGPKNKK